MNDSSDELRTLQLGPLWVLSAVAGTYSRFEPEELAAFWDTVVAVALRTPEPARQLLTSTGTDRAGLLLDFELDDRPVVSGLGSVMAALDKLGSSVRTTGWPWSTSPSDWGGPGGPTGGGSPRRTSR